MLKVEHTHTLIQKIDWEIFSRETDGTTNQVTSQLKQDVLLTLKISLDLRVIRIIPIVSG